MMLPKLNKSFYISLIGFSKARKHIEEQQNSTRGKLKSVSTRMRKPRLSSSLFASSLS
jgi:hypothetical protein